jgi:SAM-dependent methyltransferase
VLHEQQSTDERADKRVSLLLRVLAAAGYPTSPPACVLDFGCGSGAYTRVLLSSGFDAYGCDFVEELGTENERLRPIETPYKLPFEDNLFDRVISDQVFEHVQDYRQAFSEIRRVLRPNGVSLHLFPARLTVRETHILVPLATIIQARAWLWLWAQLGIRNQFQLGKTPGEVVELNSSYLKAHTTYYSRRRVLREARAVFPNARMLDHELVSTRPRRVTQRYYALSNRLPILAVAWSESRSRALLLV